MLAMGGIGLTTPAAPLFRKRKCWQRADPPCFAPDQKHVLAASRPTWPRPCLGEKC